MMRKKLRFSAFVIIVPLYCNQGYTWLINFMKVAVNKKKTRNSNRLQRWILLFFRIKIICNIIKCLILNNENEYDFNADTYLISIFTLAFAITRSSNLKTSNFYAYDLIYLFSIVPKVHLSQTFFFCKLNLLIP